MRSKSRSVLVALLAVFALGAVASASASAALPEFKHGTKESFPVTFDGEGGSASWKIGNLSWTCTTDSTQGTISAAKTLTGVTVVFKGCFAYVGQNRFVCQSHGAAKEEIKTEPLEATLVYISKTAKTVGIDLKAQTGTAVVKRLECDGGAEAGEVRGSIVIPITSVNKMSSRFTLATRENQEYENESGEKKTAGLESNMPNGVFGPASWALTSNLTTSRNIEITA